MKQRIAGVLTLILAVIAAGLYLHDKYDNWLVPLAFCVIAVALITFFWFVSASQVRTADAPLEEGVLRTAIAASIVVEYLILVGMFAFWRGGVEKLPAITELLVTSFTTVVGVVIAFYFGASAYVEAKSRTQSGATASSKGQAAQSGAAGDAPQAARP